MSDNEAFRFSFSPPLPGFSKKIKGHANTAWADALAKLKFDKRQESFTFSFMVKGLFFYVGFFYVVHINEKFSRKG
ncbi:hypothetical protein SRABI96_01972 [Peribacillus sp. Bi96]|nr:hypothetical protein SRABI96_01972 [Peribacillus sp. Bi96]